MAVTAPAARDSRRLAPRLGRSVDSSSDALRQGVPTSHAVDFARDVARFLRSEKNIDRCQFGQLAGSAQGNLSPEMRNFLRRLAAARLKRSPHRTGRHGIDADTLGGDLLGQGLGITSARKLLTNRSYGVITICVAVEKG